MEVRLRFVMEHAIQDSNLLAELSGQAPAVLLLMATYGDANGQNIRVSVSRLAANLGVSRDTIERAQKTLREAGLLTQVGRTRDGVCKYTLTLPGMDAASKPAPVRHNHVPSNKHKETIGGISPSTSPRTTRFARSTTPSVSSLADNATPQRAPVKKATRPSIKPNKTTKPDVEGIARRVRAMKAKRDNKNTPPTPLKPVTVVKKAPPPHTLVRKAVDFPTAKPEPKETRLRKNTTPWTKDEELLREKLQAHQNEYEIRR